MAWQAVLTMYCIPIGDDYDRKMSKVYIYCIIHIDY